MRWPHCREKRNPAHKMWKNSVYARIVQQAAKLSPSLNKLQHRQALLETWCLWTPVNDLPGTFGKRLRKLLIEKIHLIGKQPRQLQIAKGIEEIYLMRT